MIDPLERLRAANPVPDCPPRPVEELWRRLGSDPEEPRSQPQPRRPSVGGVMVAISAALAVGITVLAFGLLGRGRSSNALPSKPTAGTHRGALRLGSQVGADRTAQRALGAPILSTVKLVVQRRDPRGGPLWGMREFQTTGGQTCLQVGRVQNGTIGVLGEDGAWGDDHRFHPIFPNASFADYCSETDRDGHAFENVTQASETVNGAGQMAELDDRDVLTQAPRTLGCGVPGAHGSRCRRADLRVLQYGLLGPDAASINYVGPGGQALTEPTVGPDGGYLIVERATKQACRLMWRQSGCEQEAPGGYSYGPTLEAGLVTSVRYRDGHVCRVPPAPPFSSPAGTPQGSCPVVGYVAPGAGHLTGALLAAPVTVRQPPGKSVVDISFTAHVAVTNLNSYYEYRLDGAATPSCSNQTGDSTAGTDIRAGQRVVLHDQIKAHCTGVLSGTVAFVPNVGPGGSEYAGGAWADWSPSARSITVGHFKLTVR